MTPDLLRIFETLDPSSAYRVGYSWPLVGLSIAIAILAAFVALSIADRMSLTETPRGRAGWACAGALSMGGGIWSMHFIGMVAFSLPCGVSYNPFETLLSMAPGVLASGVALSVFSRPSPGIVRVGTGAVLMGAGIGAMHYAGMGAMRPEAIMRFDFGLVLVSVGVAVVLAFAALDIRYRLEGLGVTGRARTLIAAIVMGCAIPGMHYTAMQAAVFYPLPGGPASGPMAQTGLAFTVAAFGLLIGLAALAAAFAGEQREVANRLIAEMAERMRLEQDAKNGAARLQAIFDAVVDAIVVIDANGDIRQWSTGARRIFGYEAAEVEGRNVTMLMPEPHRSAHHRYVGSYRKTAVAKVIGSGRELTAIRKDGTEFPIELAVSEVKSEGEQLFTGIMRDITDRKRAEQELILARIQAEEANAAKSQFLATMSHEIRTPMNGVLGMAQLLSATKLSDQQGRLVANLSRSGQALLGIINDILDFSKIEAGKLDLTPVEFDPREVMADVADLFGERCAAKGLELIYFVADEVPARVVADSARLRQVLVNLVGNAIKFTDHGEVLVELTAARVKDGRPGLAFNVSDSGIGIAADKLAKVFESFEQVDHSMRRARGGSGLGLAICRQLVELMGGEISVESVPGRGSRFRFDIACTAAQAPAAADRTVRHAGPAIRVLLADANRVSAGVLSKYLRRWGVEVEAVETLDDARRTLADEAFDAVLLDVKGLGAAAVEFAAGFAGEDGPAVVLLTSVDRTLVDGSLEATGAFAMLSKPVRQSELFDCLAAVAKRSETGLERFTVRRAGPQSLGRFKARLLVAEDNPVNQDVATGILEAMGCEVVTAPNGRVAVELMSEQRFDLVLMDCEMPEMDGLEATRRIREAERRAKFRGEGGATPIVALTAHALADIQQACMDAGMDDFLTKPFDERQINDALRRWIPQLEVRGDVELAPLAMVVTGVEASAAGEFGEEAAIFDRSAFDKVGAFRGANGPALIRRVVDKFQQSAPTLAGAVRGKAEEGDVEALWRAAHSLKSSAAAVGAMQLSNRAAEIEALGRAGDLGAVAALVTGLDGDLSAALAGLTAFVEEPDARVA